MYLPIWLIHDTVVNCMQVDKANRIINLTH